LNVASRAYVDKKGATYADEKADEKALEKEKEHGSAELHSVDEDGPIIVPDPDLDPVALHKAYRFAAWSSVLLVCTSFFFIPTWARC
jgi:urea-proton symporter